MWSPPRRSIVAAAAFAMLAAPPATQIAPAFADPTQPCPSCGSGTNPQDPGSPPGGSSASDGQQSVGGGGKMGQAPPAKPSSP